MYNVDLTALVEFRTLGGSKFFQVNNMLYV